MQNFVAKWMGGWLILQFCILWFHSHLSDTSKQVLQYYNSKGILHYCVLRDPGKPGLLSTPIVFQLKFWLLFFKLRLQRVFLFYNTIRKTSISLLRTKCFSFGVPITAFPKAHMPSTVKMLDTKLQFV